MAKLDALDVIGSGAERRPYAAEPCVQRNSRIRTDFLGRRRRPQIQFPLDAGLFARQTARGQSRRGTAENSNVTSLCPATGVPRIVTDPNDSNAIYTIDEDSYTSPMPRGGTAAFATGDGGRSWTAISNSLQQADYILQPSCVAVHPTNGNYIYMGTASGAFYVSNKQG
jgi:hypothetical protein